jgi:O-6-methylguanine DNA methyltransferase
MTVAIKQQVSFKDKVLQAVIKIPKGSTLSYAEIAKRAGSSKAFRAVGSILAANSDKNIPCHRVIRSNGTIGKYNGLRNGIKGMSGKKKLLRSEGALKSV